MNSWICLIIAGIFEMLWVLSLELSDGFSKIKYILLTIIFMIISIVLLSFSFETIPMGTAYACWTAIGAIGVIIIGMIFFNESTSFVRLGFIAMVIIGIVGLKLTTA